MTEAINNKARVAKARWQQLLERFGSIHRSFWTFSDRVKMALVFGVDHGQ